jgi:hypothetical protein
MSRLVGLASAPKSRSSGESFVLTGTVRFYVGKILRVKRC